MKKLILILAIWLIDSTIKGQISNLTDFALQNLDNFVDDDSKHESNCKPEDGPDTGLLGLLEFVAKNYLKDCVNVILYDRKFEEESQKLDFNLKSLLKKFPVDYVNGQVRKNDS